MTIERIPITSEAQWLEGPRKGDITASVVGALAGDHPYVTIGKLNAIHRGTVFPEKDRDDPFLRRGRWFEPVIPVAMSERRPDLTIKQPRIYVRDPDLRFGCTPDFFADGDPRGQGVVQAKTVLPHIFARDWNRGEDPPRFIIFQTLTEAMLTGAAYGLIAALVCDPYSPELYLHEVPRHPSAEERLKDLVRRFWDDVDAGRDPPIDFARDGETIAALLKRETKGKTFDAAGHNELPEILAQRALLMARMKQDEARCDEIENEIKFTLGDAEKVEGLPDWKITFKTTERAGYTVAPKPVRSLRIYDRRPLAERPDGSEED
jgi:predicted phage-related endonuclease